MDLSEISDDAITALKLPLCQHIHTYAPSARRRTEGDYYEFCAIDIDSARRFSPPTTSINKMSSKGYFPPAARLLFSSVFFQNSSAASSMST